MGYIIINPFIESRLENLKIFDKFLEKYMIHQNQIRIINNEDLEKFEALETFKISSIEQPDFEHYSFLDLPRDYIINNLKNAIDINPNFNVSKANIFAKQSIKASINQLNMRLRLRGTLYIDPNEKNIRELYNENIRKPRISKTYTEKDKELILSWVNSKDIAIINDYNKVKQMTKEIAFTLVDNIGYRIGITSKEFMDSIKEKNIVRMIVMIFGGFQASLVVMAGLVMGDRDTQQMIYLFTIYSKLWIYYMELLWMDYINLSYQRYETACNIIYKAIGKAYLISDVK